MLCTLYLTTPTLRSSHVPTLPPHRAWCRLHAKMCNDVQNATCETLWCHLHRSCAPVSPTRPTPRKFEPFVARLVPPFPRKRRCCSSSRDHERSATCWCIKCPLHLSAPPTRVHALAGVWARWWCMRVWVGFDGGGGGGGGGGCFTHSELVS